MTEPAPPAPNSHESLVAVADMTNVLYGRFISLGRTVEEAERLTRAALACVVQAWTVNRGGKGPTL